MFVSSKQLFFWHLSRRLVRMESAGKGAGYLWEKAEPWLPGKDQWESVIGLFQTITAWLFSVNYRSFSCALHSNDSSRQASEEKLLRRHEHFIQSIESLNSEFEIFVTPYLPSVSLWTDGTKSDITGHLGNGIDFNKKRYIYRKLKIVMYFWIHKKFSVDAMESSFNSFIATRNKIVFLNFLD